MSRQHRQDVRPGFGLLGLWSSVLLCGMLSTVGATAETATPRSQTEPSALQAQPQERFLQHFMNQSLGKETPQTGPALTPAAPSLPSPGPDAVPAKPGLTTSLPPVDLTTTSLKMVFALGGMLGLLILVAYGIRRYLLTQSPLGKRQGALRVIGRVALTPKASVALVEVPGKVVVVGITGTTLTALGEVALSTLAPSSAPAGTDAEAPHTAPAVSFAATLDERSEALGVTPEHVDMFVRVSEAIQHKVSRLKQI